MQTCTNPTQSTLSPVGQNVGESRPQPTALGTLSCLPLEIRREIWHLLLPQKQSHGHPRRSDVTSLRLRDYVLLPYYKPVYADRFTPEILRLNRTLSAEVSMELYGMRTLCLCITNRDHRVIVDNLELKQLFLEHAVYRSVCWEKFRGVRIFIQMDCLNAPQSPYVLQSGHPRQQRAGPESQAVLIYNHCMQSIVEKLKKAPRLPRIEIELSKELTDLLGVPSTCNLFLPQMIDSMTRRRISYLDLILSPLRSLTNVESIIFTGGDQDSLNRCRVDWISDFPRPLESLVTLPRGALSPKENEFLDNHIKAVEILMDVALDTSFDQLVQCIRRTRREDPNYIASVGEKIDTCDSLTYRQKLQAYDMLKRWDRSGFEKFVDSKEIRGVMSKALYKPPQLRRPLTGDFLLHREPIISQRLMDGTCPSRVARLVRVDGETHA